MKEREISLLDLFVELLLQWRGILAWMAVGAVIFGAFSYVQSWRVQEAQMAEGTAKEQTGEEQAEYLKTLEGKMTDSQLQNVRDVMDYEAAYQHKLAYQKASVLMRIDPNKVQEAELTFCVSSESWRKSSSIERVYEDLASSVELCAYVEKQRNSDGASVKEGISCIRGSGGLPEGSNTFRVRVIHFDKDVCQGIAQAVVRFINEKHDGLEKTMGKHEIAVADQSLVETADMKILEYQKNSLSDSVSMKTAIAQYKGAFTQEEQEYYDCLAEMLDTQGREEYLAEATSGGKEQLPGGSGGNRQQLSGGSGGNRERLSGGSGGSQERLSGAANGDQEQLDKAAAGDKERIRPGVSMKYVILGMAFAAFAYAFIFFLRYVLSARLHAADNLQELYGIPQLGTIPRQEGKKLFGFIDQRIRSLRDHKRRRFSQEEALRLSAAAVRMAAVKENLGEVSLISGGGEGASQSVSQEVGKLLAQEDIQARLLKNVLYDAKAMCSLQGAKGVVLVEQAGSALYSEIAQELELLKRQGVPVLGGILAE